MDHDSRQERMRERIEAQHRRIAERLEQQQQRLDEQIERQQRRIEERLERQQARLAGRLEQLNPNFDGLVLNDKQQAIVAAALELLHTKTLDELSLRDIAKAVHMQAPALYWHFKNKATLIDFMAEAMLQREFSEMHVRAEGEPWDEWLLKQMKLLRKAMLAYPDGGRVVAGAHPYPAVTLGKIFEYLLESLHSAGMPLGMAGVAVSTVVRYAFGYVIEEQSSPSAEELKSIDISKVLGHAPYTAKLLQAMDSLDDEAHYVAGVRLIIAGIKVSFEQK
jgi:TetR/AcrR family transcriptional regulator, tetracycline repressor protein